jgi:hypothetical protein
MLHDTGSADHRAAKQVVALFAHLEVDIVDLIVSATKRFLKRGEQFDVLKGL